MLEGGGGADRELGGAGNDRFVLHVGFAVGNVWDWGAGTDTFDFRAIGAGFSGISINLVLGYADGAGTSSLVGIENVWGSDSAEFHRRQHRREPAPRLWRQRHDGRQQRQRHP